MSVHASEWAVVSKPAIQNTAVSHLSCTWDSGLPAHEGGRRHHVSVNKLFTDCCMQGSGLQWTGTST